jgi:ABC-type molybdenum transport system ATPase subunit/photorepair protein PhrA
MSRSKRSGKSKGAARAKSPAPEPPTASSPNEVAITNGGNQLKIRLGYREPEADIKIEHITVAYGSNVLIKDQSLSLTWGRRYGLVGRNGCGKSSLLRMIAQREFTGLSEDSDIFFVDQEVCLPSLTAAPNASA